MSSFVLVPGMWIGAWAWREVAAGLRSAGHEAYPVTLTGVADRAHLTDAGRPRIDLDTHVEDIVRLLAAEDLREVVLVAHSYAGAPVTCVAERAADRLARVVYVDSGVFADGVAQLDMNPPRERERVVAEGERTGFVPPRPWDPAADPQLLAGLDGAALELLRTRSTPHPYGSVVQPVRRLPDPPPVPATLVTCSFPVDQVRELIASGHPMFAASAGADMVGLPTGHWPMLSEPAALAAVLGRLSPAR